MKMSDSIDRKVVKMDTANAFGIYKKEFVVKLFRTDHYYRKFKKNLEHKIENESEQSDSCQKLLELLEGNNKVIPIRAIELLNELQDSVTVMI